jgi:hypothetical protein
MNVDVNGYTENHIQNIDLAYTYTENYLKHRVSEANNISLRLGTFLGFAGLLLRFNMDLPNSQPSYLLTKIGALVTSFCAIAIIAGALRAFIVGEIIAPISFIEFDLSQAISADIKFVIFKSHAQTCEELYLLSQKQIKLLNKAIICLAFSALFFTINGILVSFLGK